MCLHDQSGTLVGERDAFVHRQELGSSGEQRMVGEPVRHEGRYGGLQGWAALFDRGMTYVLLSEPYLGPNPEHTGLKPKGPSAN